MGPHRIHFWKEFLYVGSSGLLASWVYIFHYASVARRLLLGIARMGFSNLHWWTSHNFLPYPRPNGKPHTWFGLGPCPCPCLANKILPSRACGKGWSHHGAHRFCHALPSIFFGPLYALHILTKFLLAFCDTSPLSLGHSPLTLLILPHLLPLTGLP